MSKKDFFISHAKADGKWAKWIGWQLEKTLRREVFVPELEILPGDNLVLAIQNALTEAERTIVLLSRNFRSEDITESAWSTSFAQDPHGAKRLLIPVRIENVERKGLFAPLATIDLFDTDEQTALGLLEQGIRQDRGMPARAPDFPLSKSPVFPNAAATNDSVSVAANSFTPSTRSVCGLTGINPEVLAALLDKDAQASHVLSKVPKESRFHKGSTQGFLLTGHANQWPQAARHKIGYGLTLKHDLDKAAHIVPLPGENLEKANADEFLRQLLAGKLNCGDSASEIVARLAPKNAPNQVPHILYRELKPQEADDHQWLAMILLAWRDLGKQLPEFSPSHLLILINPVADEPGSKGWRLWKGRDTEQTWLDQMQRVLKPLELQDALLPRLISPRRNEVSGWAFNHLPESIKDDVQVKVEAVFGSRAEMPHGELKKYVIEILKSYVQ